jgi:hypothetical protein
MTTDNFFCKTDLSKPVKQEVNGTVIIPNLVFLAVGLPSTWSMLSQGALIEGEDSEAGSLNNSLCLAPALGVTKFIIVIDMILVTLCCAT